MRPLGIKLQSENRPLSANHPYDLRCEVIGSRPAPSITWWKGSIQMRNTKELVIIIIFFNNLFVMNIFSFLHTSSKYMGDICMADNNLNNEHNSMNISSSIHICLLYQFSAKNILYITNIYHMHEFYR